MAEKLSAFMLNKNSVNCHIPEQFWFPGLSGHYLASNYYMTLLWYRTEIGSAISGD